ncbi:UNVERIFIED_CONTAM: hypothetical protein PYX00_007299 [Menopon gallinae]|uniref:Uncharacterized protein n=1 Tax=Menopon gallinae TaxID=328185 RepID=A0AAW2HI95_9NEOP
MVERQLVDLSSNWSSPAGSDLRSILIDSSSDNVEIDIEDLNTDNCVCLVNNENTENERPYLEIKVNGCINDVAFMSEAQVVEVFGVNDEYLLTHTSELIDDWQGIAVYYSKITLPRIPVCKLKFTRARSENRLWILGLKVQVQKVRNNHNEQFNLEQIVRLLGNSQSKNINNGNNFNKFLQIYFKNSPHNSSGMILQKETVPNINGSSEEEYVSDSMSKLEIGENWLLGYIDKKLLELKKDVLHEIDVRLNKLKDETNCKLDRILSILEKDRNGSGDTGGIL